MSIRNSRTLKPRRQVAKRPVLTEQDPQRTPRRRVDANYVTDGNWVARQTQRYSYNQQRRMHDQIVLADQRAATGLLGHQE